MIHHEQDYHDRVKDLLCVHDTVELFLEHLQVCLKFSWATVHADRISEWTLGGERHDSRGGVDGG